MYLVDTSVWIEFLTGKSHPKVDFLAGLLDQGEAHVCEIVFAEICFGARDARQLEKYRDYFGALPFLHLPAGWHLKMAAMGHQLRSKGYRPFIADLLIAVAAIEHKVPLLTNDQDFGPYASLFGLELA